MPPLSYVLMRIEYNFGELISCLRVHMLPIFLEYPPSNSGALRLAGTKVIVSLAFGEYLWSGEDLEMLI